MFIHFRGDLEHYTHVNKGGEVTYLGPFNVNAFAKVDRSLSGVDLSLSLACGLEVYFVCGSLLCGNNRHKPLAQGILKKRYELPDGRRQLEEGTSDNNTESELEGEVVMGNIVDISHLKMACSLIFVAILNIIHT